MTTNGMRTVAVVLALIALPRPAIAGDPFEDAHQSLIAGKIDEVLLTISIGALSPNSVDENGFTLLDYAAQLGSVDSVKALLDHGADPLARTKDGKTAFDLAKTDDVRAVLRVAMTAAQAAEHASPGANNGPG